MDKDRYFSEYEAFTENEIESLEDKFIDEYLRTGKKPIRLLFRLYLRYWREFLLSSFFYLIKQAPVLFMPLVIAEIINAVEAYIVKGIDPMRTIISHIIFIGAIGLIIVAVLPYIFNGVFGAQVSFGGTSIIIVVSVIVETVKQVESQMLVRNYKGFLNS